MMAIYREEPTKRVYDLEELTARFGEAILDFAKRIHEFVTSNQSVVGAATIISANFIVAVDEFRNQSF